MNKIFTLKKTKLLCTSLVMLALQGVSYSLANVEQDPIPVLEPIEPMTEIISEDQINWPYAFTSSKEVFNFIKRKPRMSYAVIDKFYKDYQAEQKALAWITSDNKLTKNATIFTKLIAESEEHALNPNHYHYPTIKNLAGMIKELDDNQRQSLDYLLTDAFLSYARDTAKGRPEMRSQDSDWLLRAPDINEGEILINALKNNEIEKALTELLPKHEQYYRLKDILPTYKKLASKAEYRPQIVIKKPLKLKTSSDQIPLIRQRLIELGLLSVTDDAQKNSLIYDQNLFDAVKQYQSNWGLEDTGVIGVSTVNALNVNIQDQLEQIEINMERWRWLPGAFSNTYLLVDITGFEYFIVQDGKEVLRAKTVVGKSQRPTPVFSANLNHIVFSPYWSVPKSIAVKDKLPQLRKDPYRLARSGIRIYDRNGHEVDPGMIDWDNYSTKNFNYNLRQDPGANNALGKVKFMFPNPYAIYLHDTPTRALFKKKVRTYSSGCIRVENPIELATFLLKKQGWSSDRVQKSYNSNKENSVTLTEEMKMPVIILYMTAWVNGNNKVDFRPDIYSKDKKMINALKNLNRYMEE